MHPYLDHGGGWWHAFWGATLDASVQATLTEIAAALPPVSADAFDGDADAAVHDLYPVARRPDRARPAARGRRAASAGAARGARRRSSCSSTGSPPPSRSCRAHAGYAALDAAALALGRRRARRARTLDARGGSACTSTSDGGGGRRSCSSSGCRPRTIRRSACPRRCCGTAATTSSPSSARRPARGPDPPARGARRRCSPSIGIDFDAAEPAEAELDPETVRPLPARGDAAARGARRAGAAAGRLGARAEPRQGQPDRHEPAAPAVLERAPLDHGAGAASTGGSPSATSSSPTTSSPSSRRRRSRSSGSRAAGTRCRRSDVERALRFLERRRSGAGIVDLVRAVSGLETDEAGLELGEVTLDAPLAGTPRGRRAALPLAADTGRDAVRALPVPGARPRLAADARRPRRRRDPRRRHGPRQDGAGDRDARLRARGVRRRTRSGRRSSSAR